MASLTVRSPTHRARFIDENGVEALFYLDPGTASAGSTLAVGDANGNPYTLLNVDGSNWWPQSDTWQDADCRRVSELHPISGSLLSNPTIVIPVFGQSNASGRGTGASTAPTNASRILQFSARYVVSAAAHPLDKNLTNSIDTALDEAGDVGDANSFGVSMVDAIATANSGYDVMIVLVAKGGTSTTDWARNLSRNQIYGASVARVLAAKRITNAVMGPFVWYQGEADANEVSPTWDTNVATIWDNVLTDVGLATTHPWVYVKLPPTVPTTSPPSWATVRTQQDNVESATRIKVQAPDGPFDGFDLHLETSALESLGGTLATAIQTPLAGLLP